jgi:hypothetical protein
MKEPFSSYPKLSIDQQYECKQCRNSLSLCKHNLKLRAGGLRDQLSSCETELSMRKKGDRPYQPYLQKCLSNFEKQKNVTTKYYKKWSQLRDQLVKTQIKLDMTEDELIDTRKRLGYCKRYLTMRPTHLAKATTGYMTPDSLTSLGISNPYQNTKLT